MTFIVEITPHNGGEAKYHTCKGDSVKIGRGFDNDIVINDPFVDEHHAQITSASTGFELRDLGSVNGLEVADKSFNKGFIKAEEKIMIGCTTLRILSGDYKVAPALKMARKSKLLSWLETPYLAWPLFFSCFTVMQIWSFFSIWAKERPMVVAATAGATIAVVIIWSSLWSVASRLIRNKPHFSIHMAIISIYMLVSVVTWYVISYVDFFTNENYMGMITDYSLNFLVLSSLIYLSLCFTNNNRRIKNLSSAAIFAASVICGIIGMNYVEAQQFSPNPAFSTRMEPYLTALVPTSTLDDFMKDNVDLFASHTFKADKL